MRSCANTTFASNSILRLSAHMLAGASRAVLRDRRGVAAIEFAIVGPLLVLMIAAVLSYGGYFTMAHAVQQLANDAARATVAGMSDSERQTLAAGCISAELPTYGFAPSAVQLSFSDQAQVATVSLSYDSSSNPIWSLRGLLPMPPPVIVRSAAIQLGGY